VLTWTHGASYAKPLLSSKRSSVGVLQTFDWPVD